jgi:hypothetical protein
MKNAGFEAGGKADAILMRGVRGMIVWARERLV